MTEPPLRHLLMSRDGTPRKVPALAAAALAVLTALATLLPVLGIQPAAAATSDAATSGTASAATGTTSQAISFTFPELGLADSYRFVGGSSVGVRVPVPRALTPSSLLGTLVVPPQFGTGTLVVQSGTHYLGSVQLPPNSAQQQRVPFDLSLAAAPIVGEYATFTISIEQANADQGAVKSSTCSGSSQPLELTDPSVSYGGTFETPTSIATFLPPVLDKLIMYVPPDPTRAEVTTALNLTAATAADYHLVPAAVEVRQWASSGLPPAPTGALVRAVYIRQSTGSSATTGVSMPSVATGDTLLVLSGSASTLPRQGTLLTDQMAKVVQTQGATVLHSFSVAAAGESEQTFSQLGLSGSATFAGQQQLTFTFSEAQLGGPVNSLTVDIKGAYTPVEANAKATVSAAVDGVVLGEALLTPAGKVTLPITVPKTLISRTTTVALSMTYFPAGFSCGQIGRTMTFTVDPRSSVVPAFSAGGLAGFTALPQALFPSFEVAFDRTTAARLTAAVQTVCGIQREVGVPLHLQVVPLSTALANSEPALIVSNTSTAERALNPPLRSVGPHQYTTEDATRGRLAMDRAVASLQVFDQKSRQRTVVYVTTTGSWQLPRRLFAWLGNTGTKWSALTGDVLAVGPKGTPADLTVRAGGPQVFTVAPKNHTTEIVLAIGVVFALAVVFLIAWAVLRRRRLRRRQRPEPQDG